MKGIVLAGGSGTRMFPLTKSVSKQLLGVYDKPAIFYPLSILMLADVREIALIVNPHEKQAFIDLLGDGSQYGIKINYFVQSEPRGIADAYNVVKNYIEGESSMMILGDNFFYGYELPKRIRKAIENNKGATVFAMQVKEPKRFGVLDIKDPNLPPRGIVEKPAHPPSNWAVTGLYIFDKDVTKYVNELQPSTRGELEITELIDIYLKKQNLKVEYLGRGTAWLDTGTPDGMLSCASFVKTVEERQGFKIACLEEISYRRGFMTLDQITSQVKKYPNCSYRDYILQVLEAT
ncbi:MAG: glucose-1-phosphate thymidylyltransferase RfbA [Bdellovibrionaceae bacterium]|nr:glucose-1-phosphate thymidylyltransferase RfbA [Pseudobdellovibrionaceae bacterium]